MRPRSDSRHGAADLLHPWKAALVLELAPGFSPLHNALVLLGVDSNGRRVMQSCRPCVAGERPQEGVERQRLAHGQRCKLRREQPLVGGRGRGQRGRFLGRLRREVAELGLLAYDVIEGVGQQLDGAAAAGGWGGREKWRGG